MTAKDRFPGEFKVALFKADFNERFERRRLNFRRRITWSRAIKETMRLPVANDV